MSLSKFRHHPGIVRVTVALGVLAVGWMGYRAYGLPGIAFAVAGIVMWGLLNMTRMLLVLKRTAQRPVGSVASAVMLHSRLARGMTLLQVLALTRSLGHRDGTPDHEPEEYRWSDGGGTQVLCSFTHGKLVQWELMRP